MSSRLEKLENKGLGTLIDEMVKLVIEDPRTVKTGHKRYKLYREYVREINKREDRIYQYGGTLRRYG